MLIVTFLINRCFVLCIHALVSTSLWHWSQLFLNHLSEAILCVCVCVVSCNPFQEWHRKSLCQLFHGNF